MRCSAGRFTVAVSISDIPFDYVVQPGCQVIVDVETVINPTSERRAASEMDVTLALPGQDRYDREPVQGSSEDDMFNALMELARS